MTGEVTRKSVLLECLSIMRSELRIMSRNYNSREPAEGMEEAFMQGRQKIEILEDLIHALDSEQVRHVIANWQQSDIADWQREIMEHGIQTELRMD